ncbi:MAG: hypothetical protein IKX70_02255 [Treponema sp.]|nr:hypothetical protein [Treponema sp.]MBR5032477.1 hypothetical protein [Treponema sp.]
MKKLIFLLIFAVSSFTLFAQIKVLSPIEGTFSNRQMLVIDTEDQAAGDYYYSLNGSDPEAFGFAYDGPVLIDLDGPVELRIARAGKTKSETTIKYTVLPDGAYTATYASFVASFFDTGILNYTSGSILSIPQELKYSFGLPPDSFLQGRDLSIDAASVLTRYIPCTLLDESTGRRWRFIVRTLPQTAGVYSRRDVPFVITDWNTITFTNDNYIYKIDSEYWSLPKNSIKLDRSVSHMIRWQSIDYAEGNPIDFFVLPPEPVLNQTTNADGSLHFTLEGDSAYSMSILSSSQTEYHELFTELGADTFYGDNVSGTLDIGFFAGAVYQGYVQIPYSINKRPPSTPLISSSAASFYSREPVSLTIQGENYSELYYAVSEPYTITSASETYSANSDLFNSVRTDNFIKAASNTISLELKPEGSGAVYFKVAAYSQNGGNNGPVSEYSVIIDQYNYYYNSIADASIADGTSLRPYASFEQCLEEINKGRYACLRVKGTVKVPAGTHYILSNCVFVNEENAAFEFEKGASIVVKNSNVSFQNFTISSVVENALYSSGAAAQGLIPYFKLEDSVLDIDSCQISALFDKDGLFAEAVRSSVNINGTIASVSASSYTSFISGIKSKVNIQNSSINLTSETCVTLSLNQGDINLVNNSFKVSGSKGRIAELFNVTGIARSNSFKSALKSSSNTAAVYTDKNCLVTQEKNDTNGWF